MAEIVGLFAVPHTPSFVAQAKAEGARSEPRRLFDAMRSRLERCAPEVIVSISNDHFNTFWFDNWPTFAIGIAERTAGPNDQTPDMPRYDVRIEADGARHLLRSFSGAGFDFAASSRLEIDHGTLVPLHFMTPDMATPIVPIFVNCLIPPLPSARRCHALGGAIAAGIRSWERNARVAVIASGSLSLEIGGPRAEPGWTFGVPDPDWAARVVERVRGGDHDALIAEATETRMLQAGNVAGELLSWIVALGIAGKTPPAELLEQLAFGNAFAAWDAEDLAA